MTATATHPFQDAVSTWNRRFQTPGFVFGTEPNACLREQARYWQPGRRVMCVADGEGRNSVWLARQGLRVDAFDIADAGATKARGLSAAAGVAVNFAVCDCDAVVWPQAVYDGVAGIFVQFAGTDSLALRAYESDLAEGPGHNGRSALIGLVARRH